MVRVKSVYPRRYVDACGKWMAHGLLWTPTKKHTLDDIRDPGVDDRMATEVTGRKKVVGGGRLGDREVFFVVTLSTPESWVLRQMHGSVGMDPFAPNPQNLCPPCRGPQKSEPIPSKSGHPPYLWLLVHKDVPLGGCRQWYEVEGVFAKMGKVLNG